MPRQPRAAEGGCVYHVLNRANDRRRIFARPGDFTAFEDMLAEAHQKVPMRTITYCLMPNHWHLVLWPSEGRQLSAFMHRLTLTHAHRWRAFRKTTGAGHLYQGRFKSFPVSFGDGDPHYQTVCRYVERNALRAGLVDRAEQWPYCGLFRRQEGQLDRYPWLTDGPEPWAQDWVKLVNTPMTEAELEAMQVCVSRGRPYGREDWVRQMAKRLGIESSLRPRGRPRKNPPT